MKLQKTLLATALSVVAFFAQANPVDVSYTTTGSAGNWTYDFSVTNNLGGTNNVYFFGVQTPGALAASPTGFSSWGYGTWTSADSAYYGGPSINFNNTWYASPSSTTGILSGLSLNGFTVLDTSLVALTSVSWYAYAYGGTYTGGGNYNNSDNPGFSGTAGAASNSVPEPASLALLGLGLVGLAARRRQSLQK